MPSNVQTPAWIKELGVHYDARDSNPDARLYMCGREEDGLEAIVDVESFVGDEERSERLGFVVSAQRMNVLDPIGNAWSTSAHHS